jgi:hypothetical protein
MFGLLVKMIITSSGKIVFSSSNLRIISLGASNNFNSFFINSYTIALGFDSQGIMEQLASYYSKGKKTLDEYTVGNAYVNQA